MANPRIAKLEDQIQRIIAEMLGRRVKGPRLGFVTITDVLSQQEWRASSYYRDYCSPQGVFHVLAADITTRNGGIYGFRVTRPETAPDFSKEDIRFCGLLIPHIKRALNLHLSTHQSRLSPAT